MTLPPPPLERLRELLPKVKSAANCLPGYAKKFDIIHRDIAEDFRVAAEVCEALPALLARIGELEAEIARLRNINNEDGLVDPELAAQAGTPMSLVEAAARTLVKRGEAE